MMEEFEYKSHWYYDDQAELSQKKIYKRTVQRRINFIVGATTDYIGNRQRKSKEKIRVLDAGCGDGVMLRALSSVKGCLTFGCDYNNVRVRRSMMSCSGALLVNGSLINMPFRNQSFDIVIMNQVLEHINDDVQALRRINDLLDINGIFLLGVPNEGSFFGYIRNNLLQRRIRKDTDHKHFYTEYKISDKIRKCGFEVLVSMRDGFMFPHVWINNFMMSFDWGFNFAQFLGTIFRSQCAGLYFVCKKIKDS